MLVEFAIGDAYGMGFEFATPELRAKRPNDGKTYYPHPNLDAPVAPGHYTDDTQMTMACAEVLLHKGDQASPTDFAEAFVKGYKRDPRNGYSTSFAKLLGNVETAGDLIMSVKPIGNGAGAAMRATPFGYLPTLDLVQTLAYRQARITHNEEAAKAAIAVAAMTHYGLYSLGSREDLREWLLKKDIYTFPKPLTLEGPIPNESLAVVHAVLFLLETTPSLQDCLKASVALTGDVDTVAALCMGIGSTLSDLSHNIPGELYVGLENGPFGASALKTLDVALYRKYIG